MALLTLSLTTYTPWRICGFSDIKCKNIQSLLSARTYKAQSEAIYAPSEPIYAPLCPKWAQLCPKWAHFYAPSEPQNLCPKRAPIYNQSEPLPLNLPSPFLILPTFSLKLPSALCPSLRLCPSLFPPKQCAVKVKAGVWSRCPLWGAAFSL